MEQFNAWSMIFSVITIVWLSLSCDLSLGDTLILREDIKSALENHVVHQRQRRDACGGTFSHETPQKVFTSPNYPNDYQNSLNCYYTIEVPPGHYIEVTFEDFRIEIPRTSSSNCTYDGLTVHDGTSTGEPMGRYCGKVKPPDFMSRTNVVLLHLYSDESLGFRGFKLSYKVHCGTTFFSEHGTLLFSELEEHISPTNSCDYELVATPMHYIDLNFTVNALTVTDVVIFDHGNQVRKLRTGLVYPDMKVRVVSTSNIVRIRFIFSGQAEGNAIVAYQAHPRQILSGSPVFLMHLQTCRGLRVEMADGQNNRASAVASNTTKDAVLHRIERVGGHMNDSIGSGDEIYIRTMDDSGRPLSLSAARDGSVTYDDTAHDNATWRLFGELKHGGRVWLENKQLPGQYLGIYGSVNQAGQQPTVKHNIGLCGAEVDWVIYKVPLDFGWDKFTERGAFEARWVDGLPVAAYSNCLMHPLLFPYCAGTPQQQCSAS